MSNFKRFTFHDGMPIYMEHVMSYIKNVQPQVRPVERCLMMELIRMHEYNYTFASFQRLGKAIGCSANTAESAAIRLKERGWIQWVSGSQKGDERRANEYSVAGFIEQITAFRLEHPKSHQNTDDHPRNREGGNSGDQPEILGGGGLHPKTCGTPHANNCAGGEVDIHKSWQGPSQDSGSSNCIKNRIYIAANSKQQQPRSFADKGELWGWIAKRPALKGITYECFTDFYEKMSNANWIDKKSGSPIGNMEKYILAWQERFVLPDGYVDPSDSYRLDDEIKRELERRFGPST